MISASIVLYNTDSDLIKSVISSYQPGNERKLFILDNSPSENQYCLSLCEANNDIEYIFNNSNLGYGSAHNIAIDKAIELDSDYHIVLNPDIRFNTNIIDELINYANENSDVVYILPKVVYPDGSLQYLCKLLPNPFDLIFRRFLPFLSIAKKRNERYILKNFGYDKIINPPCLSGCFMFLRVSTLRKNIIRFDERFFMYCEDFDLIRRLHRVGKTIYYPYVEIIHDHAQSSYKSFRMLKCHVISAVKYFNKYGWFFDNERKLMNKEILYEISR